MRKATIRQEFGNQLKALRKQHGLSVRALAAAAKISSVWLTLIENGHVAIGSKAVEQLAQALKLNGEAKDKFVFGGLECGCRNVLTPASRAFPPRINNLLAGKLMDCGIKAKTIKRVDIKPSVEPLPLTRSERPDLCLYLNNGTVVFVTVQIDKVDQKNGEPVGR